MSKPVENFHFRKEGDIYILEEPILYYSPRYRKYALCPKGMRSDGASGPAEDIVSMGWWIHDRLWQTMAWEDNTPCTYKQSSFVLYDILRSEGRWFRARSWGLFTCVAGYSHAGWHKIVSLFSSTKPPRFGGLRFA